MECHPIVVLLSSPSKAITQSSSCRREAAEICPRPGLQVVTRYTSHTHMDQPPTRCPCWLKRPGDLGLWPFDLKIGVRVMCDVGYLCADLNFPRPLCSRLRHDVRRRQTDRQTDVRRASSLNFHWTGHNKSISRSIAALIWNATWHASCNRAQNLLFCSYRKIRRQTTILHTEYNTKHYWYLSQKEIFPHSVSYLTETANIKRSRKKHRSGDGNRTCGILLNLTNDNYTVFQKKVHP